MFLLESVEQIFVFEKLIVYVSVIPTTKTGQQRTAESIKTWVLHNEVLMQGCKVLKTLVERFDMYICPHSYQYMKAYLLLLKQLL